MAEKIKKIKQDLKALSLAELVLEAKKRRTEVKKIRLEKSTGREKNVRRGYHSRKKLAKILTLISVKQLELATKNRV